jgi:lysophospholipase L1-like esterase
MEKRAMKTALTVLLLAVLGGCCPEFLGDEQAEIATIGDSILSGGGSACKNMPGNRGGMPLYLSELLEEQIFSEAVGGTTILPETIYDIPWQYEQVRLLRPSVQIIVVDGGYNDLFYAWQRGELTEEKVAAVSDAMDDLLSEISSEGYFAVAVGCHNNIELQDLDEPLETLRQDYAAYAAGFGFAYYNLHLLMQAHQEYYYDSIHLNDLGHRAFAEAVREILE